MGRKLVLAAAAFVLLAGCTAQDGDNDAQEIETPDADVSAPPEVIAGEPIEFTLDTPGGFTLAEGEDRPTLVSENHVSQVFNLNGGGVGDRIMVTSYVLDQPVAAGDFDGLVAVIAAYDAANGQPNEVEWYTRAIVHRMPAVHRYIELGGDSVAKEYNRYIAVDAHLVQITCQWETNFAAVMEACEQLEQTFPVPEGWDVRPAA